MATQNLWGKMPTGKELRSPTAVLREQAALLAELTGDALRGHVRLGPERETFHAWLSIIAPALGNFSYGVVHVMYGVTLYPLEMIDLTQAENPKVVCESEPDFLTELGRVLSSEQVKKVIAGLLAQSLAER